MRVLQLREYEPLLLPSTSLSDGEAWVLYEELKGLFQVEFPSPVTNGHYRITSLGWVGFFHVDEGMGVHVLPKVPLSNLFGMLEVAYRMDGLHFGDGLYKCSSLDEFFDCLANVLAGGVLLRCRRGLLHQYEAVQEDRHQVRGRIDLERRVRTPWRSDLPCVYDNHTGDIEDNRILLWTLRCVLRTGLCREETSRKLRQGMRGLAHVATLVPCLPAQCLHRIYHRLNSDYEPLHALCRFFLENCGAAHDRGEDRTLPFSISMARLFELFVSEWLGARLPDHLSLGVQHHVDVGVGGDLHLRLDLLVSDTRTGNSLVVLDTKYKLDETPADSDRHQVVAYAVAVGAREAWLVYPRAMPLREVANYGGIRVRQIGFDLSGSLCMSGATLVQALGEI
jgi:5-methylcytosine-specific restriction enzyme subunit McrC